MLHEAIFLATCNATMTTEKHCKFRGGVTRSQFLFATCNAPAGNYKVQILHKRRTRSDWLILIKLRCTLRLTCHTQQLVSQRCGKKRIVLLFLQLATQHFVALQVAKMGCYTCNFFRNLQRNKRCVASCRKNCVV